MRRYILTFTLKEEFYSHTPEDVVQTRMEMSVIAESVTAALNLVLRRFAHFERYILDEKILEKEVIIAQKAL